MQPVRTITRVITDTIDDSGLGVPSEYDGLVLLIARNLEAREGVIRENLYTAARGATVLPGYRVNELLTEAGLSDSITEPTPSVATVATAECQGPAVNTVATGNMRSVPDFNALAQNVSKAVDALADAITEYAAAV